MENHHHCLKCGDMCPPSREYCFSHRNLEGTKRPEISPALEKAIKGWMQQAKMTTDTIDKTTSLFDDAKLVAAQTGHSEHEARMALIENELDIAKAILSLQEKSHSIGRK